MLEKKLLTLAAIAGILACGACFLPPLPQRPPPPPPRFPFRLEGVRKIGVQVVRGSESVHLDPVDLGTEIARAINFNSQRTVATALAGTEVNKADAVLRVTILSEAVQQRRQATETSFGYLTLYIQDTATLTKQNGDVVWSETAFGNSVSLYIHDNEPDDGWKDPVALKRVAHTLSDRIVFRMFHIQ